MNVLVRASWSTSTSKSSGGSRGPGHRVTGTRAAKALSPPSATTIGWEFVHIAIDDCTRLAYVEVLPDEKAATAIAFLRRAVAFFGRYGITVERLLTDG